MNESTHVGLASAGTEFADNLINFVAPLADAIGPLVGPKMAIALPWLVTGLAVALPVCVALWPVLHKIAEVIPGTLDTWLLDRVGAMLERLAKWLLRKPVKLVRPISGDLEAHGDLPQHEAELTRGMSQDEIEKAKKDAGL